MNKEENAVLLSPQERAELARRENERENPSDQHNNQKENLFRSIINDQDKNKLIDRLHELINGKKPSQIGAVLAKALIDAHISKIPSQKEYESEFELKSSWEAIAKCTRNLEDEKSANRIKAEKIVIF